MFVVCLIVFLVRNVQAAGECKCTELKTGKWTIDFKGIESFPLAEEGTMDLVHDFDELYHGQLDLFSFCLI